MEFLINSFNFSGVHLLADHLLELGRPLLEEKPEAIERLQVFDLIAVLVHQVPDVGTHQEFGIVRDLVHRLHNLTVQFQTIPVLDPDGLAMEIGVQFIAKERVEVPTRRDKLPVGSQVGLPWVGARHAHEITLLAARGPPPQNPKIKKNLSKSAFFLILIADLRF